MTEAATRSVRRTKRWLRMTDEERVWLDVPFAEKDQAKALGARWDPQARRWYATQVTMARLERWAALPDIPTTLPGEDRTFGGGLFVDLVPPSCWFTNVRSCVDQRVGSGCGAWWSSGPAAAARHAAGDELQRRGAGWRFTSAGCTRR
jgi:hypothetical protein